MSAICVPLALAACGGGGSRSPSPAATATLAPASTTSPPITVPMSGVGAANAGITGSAEVVRGSGSFTLIIQLRGLPPNSNHIAHIHLGSCAANGAIDVPLQPLAADAGGSAMAATRVNREYAIPAQGWYANVHQGPDLQGDNAKPMACGDLKPA